MHCWSSGRSGRGSPQENGGINQKNKNIFFRKWREKEENRIEERRKQRCRGEEGAGDSLSEEGLCAGARCGAAPGRRPQPPRRGPAGGGGRARPWPPPWPASAVRAGAEPGETPGGCSELQTRGIWQARGGGSVFVNAGLLLYIMYFPVYNKEGDYNNFTSAHSWPVLTLGICDALFLYKRPGLGLCFLLLDFRFF